MLALAAGEALAQKRGGVLRVYHRDSPGSMSLLEEGSFSVAVPIMGVFNNLVMYDQHVRQNSLESIVPDLATRWTWNAEFTQLTFELRQGVRWHDGKPFTARDVKCTWDLLTGKSKDTLRINSRSTWYVNLEEVTTQGDHEATFHLKRAQPALLAMLASGHAPVYPCHVPAREMRQHPVGTGPFKFVEYQANKTIKVTRNPDYWKPGLPYLDGIEFTIIASRATAMLAFIAGKFDMTFPYEVTIPMLRDIKSQAPQAICETVPLNIAPNLLVNRQPPFDNLTLRRAIALSFDRRAFIDILAEGQGDLGGAMLPPPEGKWGLPPEILATLPGYDPDVAKSRVEARKLMTGLGYGPDKRLKVKLSTRNLATYRDPSAILIDHLKEIWIDAELDLVETANWVPRLIRKDFQFAFSLVGSAVDDPDQNFSEYYACGSPRNYTGYCNAELDRLVTKQSMERDPAERRRQVWEIDRRLQEDVVRPILFHMRAATCWRPEVKNITLMVNSTYNGWRLEDAWLDK
ncbi:MAG: ABC transporter substrate-binding protein [Proteobacteria bacterium]|nr:ABC transporter substrate-binding protein [Pseudomonadota bacterium]